MKNIIIVPFATEVGDTTPQRQPACRYCSIEEILNQYNDGCRSFRNLKVVIPPNFRTEGLVFDGCDFSYSKFDDCRLHGIKFKNCVFTWTQFRFASFSECSFDGSTFVRSYFGNASFYKSNLSGLDFSNSSFYLTSLTACLTEGLKVTQWDFKDIIFNQ